MRCKMCGNEKKLIRAHLIPDSLKEFVVEENLFKNAHVKSGRAYNIQTFEFDKEILCEDCDGILGIYEKELKRVVKRYVNSKRTDSFFDRKKVQFINTTCISNYIFLAIVGILWKFSVSKRHDVNLGAQYDSTFREWIQKRKVPNDELRLVSIYILGCLTDIDGAHRFLPNSPLLVRGNGAFRYHLYFCGLWIIADVGTRHIPLSALQPLDVRREELSIPLIPFEISVGSFLIKRLYSSIHAQKQKFSFNLPM